MPQKAIFRPIQPYMKSRLLLKQVSINTEVLWHLGPYIFSACSRVLYWHNMFLLLSYSLVQACLLLSFCRLDLDLTPSGQNNIYVYQSYRAFLFLLCHNYVASAIVFYNYNKNGAKSSKWVTLFENIHECMIIPAYLEQNSTGPYVNPVNVE